MDKTAVMKIISDFGRALEAENIKPQKIILFGSFSTETQRQDSDIDLVVISEDFTGKDYWERIDILSGAIYRVFEPIEAVAMTPLEWQSGNSLIADYARNGEVVYGEDVLGQYRNKCCDNEGYKYTYHYGEQVTHDYP